MTRRQDALRTAKLTAILCAGFALNGCQYIREATAVTKQSPDEFTVITKAPLVIPPDFNLRPPQPGIGSRYALDPAVQGQRALFPQSAVTQTANLGDGYSDGERLLLSKSNALNADPNIRRVISADAGEDNQGLEFAKKVLAEGATPQPNLDNYGNAANSTGGNGPPAATQTTGAVSPVVASQTLMNDASLRLDADTHEKPATANLAATYQGREKLAVTTAVARPPKSLLLRPTYDR
jgi:hypothetical protein